MGKYREDKDFELVFDGGGRLCYLLDFDDGIIYDKEGTVIDGDMKLFIRATCLDPSLTTYMVSNMTDDFLDDFVPEVLKNYILTNPEG